MQQNKKKTLYEMIDRDGNVVAIAGSAQHLGELARDWFPGQEQDEDRTGKGWDVQVVGCGDLR